MSRKTLLMAVVAALGASGCAGSRAILRGQSPERKPSPVAAAPRAGAGEREWWADPRLARVGNQAERRDRRRAVVAVPLLLSLAAASMIWPVEDWGNFAGPSHPDRKVRVGGQPEAKPVKPPSKEKEKEESRGKTDGER